ncbi:glycosyltransferase [Deinococcus marmoris]
MGWAVRGNMDRNEVSKPRIAIFTDGYLPGSKGGGPIRSIEAIVSALGDRYELFILTRDRDLGDEQPYPDREQDTWLTGDNCSIMYLSPGSWTTQNLYQLIDRLCPHLIYLNSFFSTTYVQKIYLLKLSGRIKAKILLSPRGEFSEGALKQKPLKKSVYLAAFKLIYKPELVNWFTSTDYEKNDVRRVLPSSQNIFVAENIPNTKSLEEYLTREKPADDTVRLVFISRISPKKNLLFGLNMLKDYRNKAIIDIYGPTEDERYWKLCLEAAESLPDNIKFRYKGLLEHSEVQTTFSRYDIFLFPTYGENYGHVIVEALSSGCLVMTSTETPWSDLNQRKAGWTLALNEKKFLDSLYEYDALDHSEKTALRGKAVDYAQSKFDRAAATRKTAAVFDAVLGDSR